MKRFSHFFLIFLSFFLFSHTSKSVDQYVEERRQYADGSGFVKIKGLGKIYLDKAGVAYNSKHKPLFIRNSKTGTETLFIYDRQQKTLLEKITKEGSTVLEYNTEGLITKITYPDCRVKSYSYNEDKKVTSIISSKGNKKHFTYDDEGRCIQIEKNGKSIQYKYLPNRQDPVEEIFSDGSIKSYYNGSILGSSDVHTKLLYKNLNDDDNYQNCFIEDNLFCGKDYAKMALCVNDNILHGTDHKFGHGFCIGEGVVLGNYPKDNEYSAGVRKGFDIINFHPQYTEVLHCYAPKSTITAAQEKLEQHHSYFFISNNCIDFIYKMANTIGLDLKPPERSHTVYGDNYHAMLLYPARTASYFAFLNGKISAEEHYCQCFTRIPLSDWLEIKLNKTATQEEATYDQTEVLEIDDAIEQTTSIGEIIINDDFFPYLNDDVTRQKALENIDINFTLPHDVGGICLSQLANVAIHINDITGAFYDTSLGQLILCGKKNYAVPTMNFDDFAVAVQAIYGLKTKKEDPGVSIDTVNANCHKVTYFGNTQNTNFGEVLFQADLLLKRLAIGMDPIDVVNIQGYKSIPERAHSYHLYPEQGNDYNCRVWFVPEKISLITSYNDLAMMFDEVKVQILTESKFKKEKIDFPPAEDFVQQISNNFDLYAERYPVLQKLVNLSKITAVVKWLHDNDIPFDVKYFQHYQPKKVVTKTSIKPLEQDFSFSQYKIVEKTKKEWSWKHKKYKKRHYKEFVREENKKVHVSGGVLFHLDEHNFLQNPHNFMDRLKQEALQKRPNEETFSWDFLSSEFHEKYDLEAYAIQPCAKLGAVKMKFIDAIYRDIVFTRYYHSFHEEDYGFGRGWDYLPKRIYFYEEAKKATIDGEKVGLIYVNIYLREEAEERSFTLVGYDSQNKCLLYKQPWSNRYIEYNLTQKYYKLRSRSSLDSFDDKGQLIKEKKKDRTISYFYEGQKLQRIHSSFDDSSLAIEYKNEKIHCVYHTTYQYDSVGNLKTIQTRAKTKQYNYDKENRVIRITEGDTIDFEAIYDLYHRATYLYKDQENLYKKYDALHRIQVTTLEDGTKFTQKYDDNYRLLQWSDGVEEINYRYDQNNTGMRITISNRDNIDIMQLHYNNNGQLIFYKDREKEGKYIYDKNGNMVFRTMQIEDQQKSQGFVYNEDNLLTAIYNNPTAIGGNKGDSFTSDDYIKYEYENGRIKRMLNPYGVIAEY